MDKKAFSSVLQFMKSKPWLILGMIGAMLLLTFGEQALSDVLLEVELTYADYCLAIIRLILQTVLSAVLVYAWHKEKNEAAPFAAVDIPKLFVTTLFTTVSIAFCIVASLLIPAVVWLAAQSAAAVIPAFIVCAALIPVGIFLYLRIDFYMNVYITGKSNGIFSCVGGSFRMTKGKAGKYLLFNLKYLAFYFLVELVVTFLSVFPGIPLTESARTALDVTESLFLSLFMPYRFLLKCGYYDVVLTEG